MDIIKKSNEIQKILNNRRVYGNYNFTIFVLPKKNEYGRFAVLVGKKLGKAVIRNYLKRKFRHLVRLKKDSNLSNYDFVILPKQSAIKADFEKIDKQFQKIINELKEQDAKEKN